MNCVLCGSLDDGTIIKGHLVCSECMGNYATVEEVEQAVEEKKND